MIVLADLYLHLYSVLGKRSKHSGSRLLMGKMLHMIVLELEQPPLEGCPGNGPLDYVVGWQDSR